jgi:hypothetical protein
LKNGFDADLKIACSDPAQPAFQANAPAMTIEESHKTLLSIHAKNRLLSSNIQSKNSQSY